MRLPADEKIPIGLIDALTAASHDVQSVARLSPGSLDAEVLTRAAMDARILLTFDKDYGDLAYRSEAAVRPAEILLIRSPVPRTKEACQELARVITARDDSVGHFSVIEPGRMRRRQLRL